LSFQKNFIIDWILAITDVANRYERSVCPIWFKPMADTVGYKINASGIEKVTMAHVHNAKSGENGDPVAMIQVAKSGGPTLAQGNITASDLMSSLAGKSNSDLAAKMQSGETYVNVRTDANPNGEIR
jgi:hypothetical protein